LPSCTAAVAVAFSNAKCTRSGCSVETKI